MYPADEIYIYICSALQQRASSMIIIQDENILISVFVKEYVSIHQYFDHIILIMINKLYLIHLYLSGVFGVAQVYIIIHGYIYN